ncbi:MAG: putative HAF family extracellular repeat protein [Planctomycetota bacterium]|jgi:probable HAF family extracellular repeat protein
MGGMGLEPSQQRGARITQSPRYTSNLETSPLTSGQPSRPGQRAILIMKLSLFLSLAALASPVAANELNFTYVDLGTLTGGNASVAYGLNDAQQVVGWATIPGCTTAAGLQCRRAYVWDNGVLTDLGKLSGDEDSFARSINNSGLIVGTSESDVIFGSGTYHGVFWSGGVITPLPDLGNGTSFARDVNDSGLIAGHSVDISVARDRAVTWQAGVITNVGSTETHSYNRVQGLNELGELVGFAWNLFSPNDSVAFDGAKWSTIGGIDGQFQNSEASDVNDSGMVVGLQAFPSGSWHAASWQLGVSGSTDHGTLPGLDTAELYGVNNAGMAVGSSYDGGNPGLNRAILWDGKVLHDLNDFLPAGSGVLLYEARDINENGDIAGTAVVAGEFRAFLLQSGAAWSKYDQGASASNTIDLDGAGSTSIGASFDAIASNVTGVNTIFAVSLGQASFPLLGGVGLIDPTPASLLLLDRIGVQGSQATLTLDIPNDPSIVDIEFFVQALSLASTGPNVWELSNGLMATVCQ